jgi:hypothetical protein
MVPMVVDGMMELRLVGALGGVECRGIRSTALSEACRTFNRIYALGADSDPREASQAWSQGMGVGTRTAGRGPASPTCRLAPPEPACIPPGSAREAGFVAACYTRTKHNTCEREAMSRTAVGFSRWTSSRRAGVREALSRTAVGVRRWTSSRRAGVSSGDQE